MTQIKNRRGTASQWSEADPILGTGEIGFETDTGKYKIGNGVSHWDALGYFVPEAAMFQDLDDLTQDPYKVLMTGSDGELRWGTPNQAVARALGWHLPEDSGVKSDGQEHTSGSISNGSAILTATTSSGIWDGFTSSDVGKKIAVVGAGASGATLVTTIASRQSVTQVTLSSTASTTVSGAKFSYATDDTTAFQAFIDNTVRGRGLSGWVPPNFVAGISSQLIVPGAANVKGANANGGNIKQGGSELWWFGASGVNAVATAIDAETDWSRGELHSLRVVNKVPSNTAGYAWHIRNAQNLSLCYNLLGLGFADGAFLIEETKTTGTTGATPGAAFFDRLFAIGGKNPIKLRVGSQPVTLDRSAIDTDSRTDVAGMLIEDGPVASSSRRAPVGIRGTKIEQATATTTDVPSWRITTDAPIHLDSCQSQHNSAAMTTVNTKAVVEYDPSGSNSKWGRIKMTNMACWLMAYSYRNIATGFALPNPGTTQEWVASFDWNKGELETVFFTHTALVQSMSSVAMYIGGSSGVANHVIFHNCVIEGMTVSMSGSGVVAGTVTVNIIKNGSTSVQSTVLNTGTPVRRRINMINPDVTASTPANQVFVPDDRVGIQVTTTSDLNPSSGGQLTVALRLRTYDVGA